MLAERLSERLVERLYLTERGRGAVEGEALIDRTRRFQGGETFIYSDRMLKLMKERSALRRTGGARHPRCEIGELARRGDERGPKLMNERIRRGRISDRLGSEEVDVNGATGRERLEEPGRAGEEPPHAEVADPVVATKQRTIRRRERRLEALKEPSCRVVFAKMRGDLAPERWPPRRRVFNSHRLPICPRSEPLWPLLKQAL